MAATNWNLYDELHYRELYFEGEPLEESMQDDIAIEIADLDMLDVNEGFTDIDHYGEFGHRY